jgi:hypothetical protein
MSDAAPPYKPGDVVNGHVLTADLQWAPLGAAPQAPAGPGQYPAPYAGTTPGGQQPVYVMQPDNSNNTSLAPVTSLVSGIIGLLFCWIPFIGIIGWLFGPLALVFGFLGLGRGKAEHKVMSWIGIVCGAITLVVCVIYVVAFVALSNDNTY